MQKTLLFIVFTLSVIVTHAKSFNQLSSVDPIHLSYKSDTEGYKNIQLLCVNNNKMYDSIPVELKIEVAGEVMIDYFTLGSTFNENVKTLFLYEGDSVDVHLRVLTKDSIEIQEINGNIKLNDPMIIKSDGSPLYKTLIGGYWDAKQALMFHINNKDSMSYIAKFKVGFGLNYEFDKFYYSINVLSPDASFETIEGMLVINKGKYLNLKPTIRTLSQEIKIEKKGKYIIELIPFMNRQRVNGINSVEYWLSENKKN